MKSLIELLIDEMVMSPAHARRLLKQITGCIGEELAVAGTARVTGLGTFSVAQRTIKFRPSKVLRDKINSPKVEYPTRRDTIPLPRSSTVPRARA